jgi:hypothetical protein
MDYIRPVFLKLAFTASMLLWASIAVTPATAASITFNFTGAVTSVPGSLNPPFPPATLLSGSYTFDSLTGDSKPNPNRGLYNGTIQALTVNLGSYTWTLGNSGANFIEIRNQSNDRYTMQAPLTGSGVNGFSPLSFRIELNDPSGSAFTNDLLPTTPPSLGNFTTKIWRVVFEDEDGDGRARIRGTINSLSLTAVPLPAAVILFATGLVALVGLGAGSWRQKKNSPA